MSYFLNHSIVFRQPGNYSFKKYIRFLLGTGLGAILIQDVVIFLITDKFWPINVSKRTELIGHDFHTKTLEILGAKLIAVVIGLGWNFTLYKYIIFRNHDKEDELVVG